MCPAQSLPSLLACGQPGAGLTQQQRRQQVEVPEQGLAEEAIVDGREEGRHNEHHDARVVKPPHQLRAGAQPSAPPF